MVFTEDCRAGISSNRLTSRGVPLAVALAIALSGSNVGRAADAAAAGPELQEVIVTAQ
jgi:hypothetical protein